MYRRFLVVAFLVHWVSIAPPAAQEPVEPIAVPRFRISSNKTTYAVGEPVALTATAINEGERPLCGSSEFATGLGNLVLSYNAEGQNPVVFSSCAAAAAALVERAIVRSDLAPHRSRDATEILLFAKDKGSLILDRPGVMEIRANLSWGFCPGGKRVIASNVLRLTVTGLDDRQQAAFEVWNDPDILNLLQDNAAPGTEEARRGARKLLGVLREHGTSIYARAARSILGARSGDRPGLSEDERSLFEEVVGEYRRE